MRQLGTKQRPLHHKTVICMSVSEMRAYNRALYCMQCAKRSASEGNGFGFVVAKGCCGGIVAGHNRADDHGHDFDVKWLNYQTQKDLDVQYQVISCLLSVGRAIAIVRYKPYAATRENLPNNVKPSVGSMPSRPSISRLVQGIVSSESGITCSHRSRKL